MKIKPAIRFVSSIVAATAVTFISTHAAALSSNVALLGTASQSSQYANSTHPAIFSMAWHANDGNTDGVFGDLSVNHTYADTGNGVGNGFAWWSVLLDQDYSVQQINVWNRTDGCCTDRLRDFTVSLFNHGTAVWSNVFSSTNGPLPSTTFSVGSGGGVVGNQVMVQLNREDFLHMAEVQIYGVTPAVPEPQTYAMLLAGLGALGVVTRRRKACK